MRDKIRRAVGNPRAAWSYAVGVARGYYYRIKFKLLGRRVIIGRRFKVWGPLIVKGPGTVIFGDDCHVISTRIAPTTPFTNAPDAVIRFGDRVRLTGTRLGCQESIDVHYGAGLADCRIMDTDFHSIEVTEDLRYNTNGASKPIVIGANTWICADAIVMKGVHIGENSIVGAGAVVVKNVAPNVVMFGNPARVVWRMQNTCSHDPKNRQKVTDTD